MNPEIKAKANEVLKAHGRRGLSIDEKENVVGGTDRESTISPDFDIIGWIIKLFD